MQNIAIPGKITVKPEVLETIAWLAALNVPGVVQLAETDLDRLLSLGGKSVSVQVREGRVWVDLHIIAAPNYSLLQLGRTVQHDVTRAIQEMIGMPVEEVNVTIEDVAYHVEKTTEAD